MSDDLSLARWKDMATFPSTNAKAILFLVASALTGVHLAALVWVVIAWQLRHPSVELRVPPVVEGLIDSWLLFLAGWGGLSVAQYYSKRKTYAVPSPDSERANVPADLPPTTPPPVGQAVPKFQIPSRADD